jgi:predicted molibdopterin-dependent oxidoreductase YjgC
MVSTKAARIGKGIYMVKIIIDGASYDAKTGEHLIDVINRTGREIPQVCYHPQLGPIQTAIHAWWK